MVLNPVKRARSSRKVQLSSPALVLVFITPLSLPPHEPSVGEKVLPEKLRGGVRPLPETVILFQTKICDFPNPISDLFQPLHGWHNNIKGFVDGLRCP